MNESKVAFALKVSHKCSFWNDYLEEISLLSFSNKTASALKDVPRFFLYSIFRCKLSLLLCYLQGFSAFSGFFLQVFFLQGFLGENFMGKCPKFNSLKTVFIGEVKF